MIEFIKQHGQTLIEAGGAVIMIGVFAGAFFGGGFSAAAQCFQSGYMECKGGCRI